MAKLITLPMSAYDLEIYNRRQKQNNAQNAADQLSADQGMSRATWQNQFSLGNLRNGVNDAAIGANNARGSWAADEYAGGSTRKGYDRSYLDAKIAYNDALKNLAMQKQSQADSNWAATHGMSGGGSGGGYKDNGVPVPVQTVAPGYYDSAQYQQDATAASWLQGGYRGTYGVTPPVAAYTPVKPTNAYDYKYDPITHTWK